MKFIAPLTKLSAGLALLYGLTLMLALTPLYTLAYVLAVGTAVRSLTFSRTFNSRFSRFVLSLLLFSVVIMFAGMLVWLGSLTLHPVLVLALFGILVYVLVALKGKDVSSRSWLDRGDIVSVIVALVGPLLLIASFYLHHLDGAASVQIMANGYDNTAHFSILRTDSDEDGYVYGRFEDVKSKAITPLSAYPQGWHLAVSHFIDGLNIRFFQSLNPILAINTYIAIVVFWLFLAVYIFSRIAWQLTTRLLNKKAYRNLDTVGVFILGAMLLAFLVFWPSLTLGFANYIGCIVYLSLIAAMIIDREQDNQEAQYVVAAAAVLAVAQTWLLPFAASIATVAAGFLSGTSPSLLIKKVLPRPNKRQILLLTITLAALVGSLFQVAVLFRYFSVGRSAEALTQDGGIFAISNTLAGLIILGTAIFWLRGGSYDKADSKKHLAIVLPLMIMTGAIFAYQQISTARNSYYFIKMLGLVLCMAGIYFIPMFVAAVNSLSVNISMPCKKTLISLFVLAILLPATSQSTASFNDILQRYSKVELQTADKITDYLQDYDVAQSQLIVFRNKTYEEDFLGTYVSGRTAHKPDLCSSKITLSREQPLQDKLSLLSTCASNAKHLVVITSDQTRRDVEAVRLKHPNISIMNVP